MYGTYSPNVQKLLHRLEWLQYCTNIKTRNDFNTILNYFMYKYLYNLAFYTNTDLHSLRMTHKGSKYFEVLVIEL
jgi:hypothetical protein